MCGGGGGGGSADIKETADQKALARIAAEQYERNRQIYDGAEDQYITYADSFTDPAKRADAQQMASAATTSAYGNRFNQIAKSLASSGVNVNSGAFTSAMFHNGLDQAEAETKNVNRTLQALDDTGLQAQANVVAIGNKRAGSALSGMSEIAGMSAGQAANDAQQKSSSNQADEYMAGTVAGAGYSAYRNA